MDNNCTYGFRNKSNNDRSSLYLKQTADLMAMKGKTVFFKQYIYKYKFN